MTMPSRLLLVTLAAGIASAACSSSPGTGSGQGGSGGTGATGGSSAGGSCQNVSACGGDSVGTWTVKSSCLTVNGNLNLGDFGAGCAFEPVTGTLEVTGTLTINSDRTYADDTTTTGHVEFPLDKSCLVISSTPVNCDMAAGLISAMGYSNLTCTTRADGGCMCSGTVNHKGTGGLISTDPSTQGNWAISGNEISMDGTNKYSYCASAGQLTWTPQSVSPPIAGTIVFERSGSPAGSGGASGSGGAGGTGGTNAAGSGGMGGSGGMAGIVATHDAEFAVAVADRGVLVADGRPVGDREGQEGRTRGGGLGRTRDGGRRGHRRHRRHEWDGCRGRSVRHLQEWRQPVRCRAQHNESAAGVV